MASSHLSNNEEVPIFSEHFQKKLEQYSKDEKAAMSGGDEDSYRVELFVYDMSKGLVKTMSPALLGKQIEGIWHTGVVAYGREYFFGSAGIESCRPGGTILGEPERVEDLGNSQVPYQLFLEYIFGLGESSYKPGAYDLLKHNCNNFSEELSEFLCGRGIPKHILALPDEVLNTPFGQMIAPLLSSFQVSSRDPVSQRPLGEAIASSAKALQLKSAGSQSLKLTGIRNSKINSYVPQLQRTPLEDPELDELNSAIEEVRQNTQALESRRHSLNEKLLKKERKEKKKEKKERKKKKHRSSSAVGGGDKESRQRRRSREESVVRFDPDVKEISTRRFSDPGSPEPQQVPSPKPPLPPKKSSPVVKPPSPVVRTPSPPVSSPTMEAEEATPPPPPMPDLEVDLPPEVEREPPILFKDEVDVSSQSSCVLSWDKSLSPNTSSSTSSLTFHSNPSASGGLTNSPSGSSQFLSESSFNYNGKVISPTNFGIELPQEPVRPIPVYPGHQKELESNNLTYSNEYPEKEYNVALRRKQMSPEFDHWSKDPSIFKHSNYTVRNSTRPVSLVESESIFKSDSEDDLNFKNNLVDTPVKYTSYFHKLKTDFTDSNISGPEDFKHTKPSDKCKIINTCNFIHSSNSRFSPNKNSNFAATRKEVKKPNIQPELPKDLRNPNMRPRSLLLSNQPFVENSLMSETSNSNVEDRENNQFLSSTKITPLHRPKSLDLTNESSGAVTNLVIDCNNPTRKDNYDVSTELPQSHPLALKKTTQRKELDDKISKFLSKFTDQDNYLNRNPPCEHPKLNYRSVSLTNDGTEPIQPKNRFLEQKNNVDNQQIDSDKELSFHSKYTSRPKSLNLKLAINRPTSPTNWDSNEKKLDNIETKKIIKQPSIPTSETDNEMFSSIFSRIHSKLTKHKNDASKSISQSPDDSSYHTPLYSPKITDAPLSKRKLTHSTPDSDVFLTPTFSPSSLNNNEKSTSQNKFQFESPYIKYTQGSNPINDVTNNCPAKSKKTDSQVNSDHAVTKAKIENPKTSLNIVQDSHAKSSNQNISNSNFLLSDEYSGVSSHPRVIEEPTDSTINDSSIKCSEVLNIQNPTVSAIPNQPTVSTAPNQPTVSTAPNQPTVSTASNQPTVSTAPNQPTVSTAPNQPTVSMAPNQPTVSTAPNQPSVSTAPNQPTVSTVPNKPTVSTVPNKPTVSMAPNQPTVSMAPNQPTVPIISNETTVSTAPDVPTRPPPSYETAVNQMKKCLEESEDDDEVGLSRSSTQSSVDSTMSFGSSYYTLYIMDQEYRPKTPDEPLWSPGSSPPPDDQLSRSESTSSVSSFRTITPDAEYFEENTKAFRAMRGLSMGSSNDSLLTCFSRPQSNLGSTSTLCQDSISSETKETIPKRRTKSCKSQPTSPHVPNSLIRTYSLDSLMNHCPHGTSSFGSISTFDLASRSHSSGSCHPSYPDRPPSTDSPILFGPPSQESLLLFRPLPRYSARSVSPDPEPAVLCYLGPTRPFERSIVFTSILQETVADFDGFVNSVAERLGAEEQHHMEELRAYVVEDEGSWALGDDFNMLFARIFHDPNIPDIARRHLIRIMAAAALKDDVILMLHQDRKEHTIMNFANKIESLSPDLQEALALFFCNMFEHLSPSEWLLYISEWNENNQQISNIRVTTKVAVNALLHSNPKVQEYGTALMYNLGTKEVKTVVFDDVAPELAMAILQYFSLNPPEEFVWRVLTALCRFCYASSEVPALIKMIGPDPNSYHGMSERIDQVLEEINTKLSRVRLF